MPGSLLGTSVRRVEDPELLEGRGTFVGNLRVDALAHAAFVRSPLAHARITGIDTAAASRAAGVLGVFTAEDLGVAPFHGFIVLNPKCARPPLADGKVRFVGEPVVMIVAESQGEAIDASELVVVEYEPLPAVVDPEAALGDAAVLQFDELGTNLAAGMRDAGESDPLSGATTVVRARLQNQRVAVVPMEGDAVAAVPRDDGEGHDVTVYVSTQMPHAFAQSAAKSLGIDIERLRVVAPHVGGGFGSKAGLGAEHAAVVTAARRLRRPVVWVQGRSENLVSMPHGRGQVQWVEMGFDGEGRFTGMRLRVLADCGAYAGFGGALAIGPTRMMAQGVYAIPAIRYDVAAALTNTAPMGAFRGAGRPEAAELLERAMDIAAAELEMDPVELRRRNLLPAFDTPLTTVMGTTYDTGDYELSLDEALRLAGYEELRKQQAERRAGGARHQLGIGVAVYVEITAGAGGEEYASVGVERDGIATIRVGTSAHGQGHATAFATIVSDRLGIGLDQIRFVQADTAAVPRGGGTGGSRSLQLGGSAVFSASEEVLERGKELAAAHLEANVDDIVVHGEGRLGVAGVPARSLSWGQVASLSEDGGAGADQSKLEAAVDFKQEGATFPFGAHVSVVEVDVETGAVRPLRHVAVDDCGRILNPLLVRGQQHGGIAQGMAQALWEEYVYDGDGNPLTATLADYAMPSAAEVCGLEAANTQTPSLSNPLGAKGIGESGTIGSTPAVHNAVVDALSHLGVRHVDMPCTPERVWRAIEAARRGEACERPLWSEPPAFFDELPVAGRARRPEVADVEI
ncbi:MAG TPA: xanthine dehydrogenase family protein molybdopterin-binding subunit [Acidimicrobiales bacterium]|nr:xanthine dehydrogenase family protein molybdopterin-binding subunit [Acidimicrobiales bacterium]